MFVILYNFIFNFVKISSFLLAGRATAARTGARLEGNTGSPGGQGGGHNTGDTASGDTVSTRDPVDMVNP